MARNFLNQPFAPYKGAYSAQPFNNARGNKKGELVVIDLLWALYLNAAGNFVVTTNLNVAGPNTVPGTWTIQSVYIDNEGVDFPCYIYFPDTQFTVSCPANSAGWYEVYTNSRAALIAGIGITLNALAQAQRTRLFFTDVPMVPSLDQEIQSALALNLASPNLPRFNINGANYNAPALGDQPILSTLNCTGIGSNVIALAAVGPGVFYYITGLFATVLLVGSTPNGSSVVQLRPHNLATTIWGWEWISPGLANGPVFPASGFNLKLDANQQYDLFQTGGVNTGDRFNLNIAYTISNS